MMFPDAVTLTGSGSNFHGGVCVGSYVTWTFGMSQVESPNQSVWRTLLGKFGLSPAPKAGDEFRLTTPKGEVLTGVIDFAVEARALGLVIREHDNALLRFTLEGKADGPSTFLYGYVIAFGAERERANELVAAGNSAISSS